MFVKNLELYHFNNNSRYSDIWQVGNEFDNTNGYISDYYNYGLNFAATVSTDPDGEMIHFSRIIDGYLKEEQDQDTYIRMLRQASIFLREYSVIQREMVLEAVREELYPECVSRKNAIWLCDEKQLSFWKKELGENCHDLFKVSVTGELFKSSDELLPKREMNIREMSEQAKKYWNPDFSKLVNEEKIEYLFQGKLKVLEKVDL